MVFQTIKNYKVYFLNQFGNLLTTLNDVKVIHDFHSIEKAKSFVNSKALKESMMKLGPKGTPQIWYTNKGAK
jgi:hypothetical protein